MAAIAQVPASSLGNSTASMRNVSPEAVASNDAGQDRKGGEIKTSFGETWELVLRTAAGSTATRLRRGHVLADAVAGHDDDVARCDR
jgi:hypothetical protein